MSVNVLRHRGGGRKAWLSLQRTALGVSMVWMALPALAFDLAAPFYDPLLTLPTVIKSGAILPGDAEPVPCQVGEGFSAPLALAEAIDLAMCNNPQIRSVWAGIKVQAGVVGEARAAYLPTLSATTNRLQTHTNYPGSNFADMTTNGRTIYSTLAWRLFDFGGREANRESANALLIAAVANHDAALQKILADVIQSYFDAQTAKASLQAKAQNEVIARSTLESAQRREARGAVSHSDTLQATTAFAKASLEHNRAIGAYQKALSVLVYALGVAPQTRVMLADDLNGKEMLEAKDLDTWLELAGKTHPAILAARAQWESAKYKVTATRSDGLPTIDFSANYYENGYPGQGMSPTQSRVKTVGISLSVPIFDGFSRTYKIRGAEAQAARREADLQDVEHNILVEVIKTHADVVSSVQNLEASERLLNAAQESLNSSKRKYEKGAADIPEILNTQAALSDAQQERIRSLAEWRSARLRLLASAGVMRRTAVSP
jgi:outer membrane protein